jgi:transketolase
MVAKAVEAAESLAQEGVSVKVVNVSTVKPLDKQGVIALAKGCKAVVTAEEHSVIGGLGGAIAEALSEVRDIPLGLVGIEDRFGTSAVNYDELLVHYGLTADAVKAKIKKLLG